jgi:subtilisin
MIAAATLLAMTLPAWTSAADAAPPRSSFIVVLRPTTADVATTASGMAASARGELGFVYQHAIQGFSITASDAAAAALARNPRVAYVERDQQVTLEAQDVPTGIQRIFADGNPVINIDGIDDLRVDVDVAVIDTGVDFEHPDLNVVGGVNCASGGPFGGSCKAGGDDDHYHGTHVAGTIAALDNDLGVVGVAPGARIHAVKVLNSRGSGYTSWIVAGIDWVAGNGDIEVANMSLGGSGFSQAEYDAIQGAVEAGVAFAVAAGNSNADANFYSPAAFDNVLTVSALADFNGAPGGNGNPTCRTDVDDTLADFSNWGSAVDIAAPGVCIRSTYPIEQGSYGTISGTSMASPHAAGALALRASTTNPANATDVANLYEQVKKAGNLDPDDVSWFDDSGDGIKEPLLDVTGLVPTMINGSGSGGGSGGSNSNPSVTITSPADGGNYGSGTTFSLSADTSDLDVGTLAVSWTANNGSTTSTILTGWTPADGSYTVVATATDGKGGSATDSVSITVGTTSTPTLVASSQNNGKTWTAFVTSTADVSGAWTSIDGTSAVDSCTLDVAPSCTVSLSGIPKKLGSVTFTTTTGVAVVVLKP